MEIVNKLIELKLLDVVFTSDGKEYVTPQQLNREIQDELFVNGGLKLHKPQRRLLEFDIETIETKHSRTRFSHRLPPA